MLVATSQAGETIGLEGTAIKHAVIGIDLGNQSVLNVRPVARNSSSIGTSIGVPVCSMAAAAAI